MRHTVLAVALVGLVLAVAVAPRTPQPLSYHAFADQRACGPISNCLNVLSNVPFAVVGLFGLAIVFGRRARTLPPLFHPAARWPYAVFFIGVAITALGSSYYHLAPDNARLVWDRLPMTLGFMGLLAAIVAECVSPSIARWSLVPLIVVGVASVAYWYQTELAGAGDLRPYALVQYGSLVVVVLILAMYRSGFPGTGYLAAGLLLYVVAKLFELADARIFELGHLVSGHTLKHLAAAAGAACVAKMLLARRAEAPALSFR